MQNNVSICRCHERARRKAALKAVKSMAGGGYLWAAKMLAHLVLRILAVGIIVLSTLVDLWLVGPIQDVWRWTFGEGLAFVTLAPFLIVTFCIGIDQIIFPRSNT